MVKVCLAIVCINDVYKKKYSKYFEKSHRQYCKKHGYDLRISYEYLNLRNEPKRTDHGMAVVLNKMLVCSQEWSFDYDYVIYVDADIFINIDAPPIHSFMDYGDKIALVDECSQPDPALNKWIRKRLNYESPTDYYNKKFETNSIFNSGCMVLQPKKHWEFLEEVYLNAYEKIQTSRRGVHVEQIVLGTLFNKCKNNMKLDNRFNFIHFYNSYYYKVFNSYYNAGFFLHFTGRMKHIATQVENLINLNDEKINAGKITDHEGNIMENVEDVPVFEPVN